MKNTLIKPMRVQRLRKKGFNLQKASRSGLPVKYVGRPTKFGNPFKLTPNGFIMCYTVNRKILNPWIYWSFTGGFDLNDILELYELWIKGELRGHNFLPTPPNIEELRGMDLACYCPIYTPCHADILIKIINDKNFKK